MQKTLVLIVIGTLFMSNLGWSKTPGSEKAIAQVNSTVDFGEELEMEPASSGKSDSTPGLQSQSTSESEESEDNDLKQKDNSPRRTP